MSIDDSLQLVYNYFSEDWRRQTVDGDSIIYKDAQYTVFQKSNPNSRRVVLHAIDASGEMDYYQIFGGIMLSFIKISAKTLPVPDKLQGKSIVYLNYCFRGRCEVELDIDLSTCVSEKELCICKNSAVKDYNYPSKYYDGIELFFYMDELAETSKFLLDNFQIDIIERIRYYSSSVKPFTSRVQSKIESVFEKLWALRNSERVFEMKIHALELFFLLSEKTLPLKSKGRIFLTASQVEIAKSVEGIITQDLQKNFTVLELASKFRLGETSLKNYFKALYGQSITQYVRELRMTEAARQLANTRKKVSDISGDLGYENQSKFASVFKSFFKASPLEYRRLKQVTVQKTFRSAKDEKIL